MPAGFEVGHNDVRFLINQHDSDLIPDSVRSTATFHNHKCFALLHPQRHDGEGGECLIGLGPSFPPSKFK